MGRPLAGVTLIQVAGDAILLGGAQCSARVAADVLQNPLALRLGSARVHVSLEPGSPERSPRPLRQHGCTVRCHPELLRDIGGALPLHVDHPENILPPLGQRVESLRDQLVLGHRRAEPVIGDPGLPAHPVIDVVVLGGSLPAARPEIRGNIPDRRTEIRTQSLIRATTRTDRRPDPGKRLGREILGIQRTAQVRREANTSGVVAAEQLIESASIARPAPGKQSSFIGCVCVLFAQRFH